MNLKLNRLKNKNSDELIKLLTSSIARWLEPIPYPPKTKDKIAWIEKIKKEKSFVIIRKDKITGMIWLENLDKTKRSAEIGFFLGDRYQGKGYASESVKEIINYGFSKLKLRKITALTNNFNKNSQRLLQRNNFKLIRQIKKDYRKKFNGKWCDVLIYEISGIK